jgi:capsular polysaccharide biosynthesis protein
LDQVIDFSRIFRKLLKKLWLIVTVTVVFAAVGVVMTLHNERDIYGAQVSLYSVSNGANTASTSGINTMKDYAEIVSSKMVADQVVNSLPEYNLNARNVQAMVSTAYKDGSAIFYIMVRAEDPKLAADVANAASNVFVMVVNNITKQYSVKILDAADSANTYYDAEIGQLKTRLIYAAAGLLLACVIISFIEIFSTRVSEVNDSTLNGQIKLLGVIPKHNI